MLFQTGHIDQNVSLQLSQIVDILGNDLPIGDLTLGKEGIVLGGLLGKALLFLGIIDHSLKVSADGGVQTHTEGVGVVVLHDLQAVDAVFHGIGQCLAVLQRCSLGKLTLEEGLGLCQLGHNGLLLLQGFTCGISESLDLIGHKLIHKVAHQEGQALLVELRNVLAAQVLVGIDHGIVADTEEVGTLLIDHLTEQGFQALHSLADDLQLLRIVLVLRSSGLHGICSSDKLSAIALSEEGVLQQLDLRGKATDSCLHIQLLVLAGAEQEVLDILHQASGSSIVIVVGQLQVVGADAELIEGSGHFLDAIGLIGVCLGHIAAQQAQSPVEVTASLTAAGLVLQQHSLGDLLTDAHNGVQRGQRILEDHSDFIATDLVHFLFGDLQQILTVINDLAAFDDGVAGQDAHNGTAGNGLTGAGLANDGQGLAALQVEGDIADSLHLAVVGTEGDLQILNFKVLCHYSSAPLKEGLKASRRPLPNRLKEISSREMNSAGNRMT